MRSMHKHQPTKPPRMKRFDLGKKEEAIVYPQKEMTPSDRGLVYLKDVDFGVKNNIQQLPRKYFMQTRYPIRLRDLSPFQFFDEAAKSEIPASELVNEWVDKQMEACNKIAHEKALDAVINGESRMKVSFDPLSTVSIADQLKELQEKTTFKVDGETYAWVNNEGELELADADIKLTKEQVSEYRDWLAEVFDDED